MGLLKIILPWVLCIGTLYFSYIVLTTKNIITKLRCQYTILWLDTAWIGLSILLDSYFWMAFWIFFLTLDWRTYKNWNEQEEDKEEEN